MQDESRLRTEAARTLLQHAAAGRCDPQLATEAARTLLEQALELEAQAESDRRHRGGRRDRRRRHPRRT